MFLIEIANLSLQHHALINFSFSVSSQHYIFYFTYTLCNSFSVNIVTLNNILLLMILDKLWFQRELNPAVISIKFFKYYHYQPGISSVFEQHITDPCCREFLLAISKFKNANQALMRPFFNSLCEISLSLNLLAFIYQEYIRKVT